MGGGLGLGLGIELGEACGSDLPEAECGGEKGEASP